MAETVIKYNSDDEYAECRTNDTNLIKIFTDLCTKCKDVSFVSTEGTDTCVFRVNKKLVWALYV